MQSPFPIRTAVFALIAVFWFGLFAYIWVHNARAGRRVQQRVAPSSISWIELTPLPLVALGLAWGLGRLLPTIGELIVGGLHVIAAAAALYAHLRRNRSVS